MNIKFLRFYLVKNSHGSILSNTKQRKTPLTLNYSISNQIQTKCSSQSGIIQSDDIAYENIYLNKLDKIFNKFTTNLVDLKWARESHLTLNHSNIDLISKYNQNNPVFVNLINKNIKNTSDYDDIVKYFDSNLTDLSFADLSKLFRVLNIMDNEPFNNDLILNIEKHFYASLEKHSNASAFSIHDFVNFYYGLYKLRYKSDVSVDLAHFYATTTEIANGLLMALVKSNHAAKDERINKSILDGIDCYGRILDASVFEYLTFELMKSCNSAQNCAYLREIIQNTNLSSVKKEKFKSATVSRVNELHGKKYFEKYFFDHRDFLKQYMSLFSQPKKSYFNQILSMFLSTNTSLETSRIGYFMMYLATRSKHAANIDFTYKNYKENAQITEKFEEVFKCGDVYSIFELFGHKVHSNVGYLSSLDINHDVIKEKLVSLAKMQIPNEKNFDIVLALTNKFPNLFDLDIADELERSNNVYYLLYSLLNKPYFLENYSKIIDRLELFIRNRATLVQVDFILNKYIELFADATKKSQLKSVKKSWDSKILSALLVRTSDFLLHKGFKRTKEDLNEYIFKLEHISYSQGVISRVLDNLVEQYKKIPASNSFYFKFNQFQSVTSFYLEVFNHLKNKYGKDSLSNDDLYQTCRQTLMNFPHQIRYFSMIGFLPRSTKQFTPVFAKDMLQMFNTICKIVFDPFFDELNFKIYKNEEQKYLGMLLSSLKLFSLFDIDDVRNNLKNKEEFDKLLKQTHTYLNLFYYKLKDGENRTSSMFDMNILFLNLNYPNETAINEFLKQEGNVKFNFE